MAQVEVEVAEQQRLEELRLIEEAAAERRKREAQIVELEDQKSQTEAEKERLQQEVENQQLALLEKQKLEEQQQREEKERQRLEAERQQRELEEKARQAKLEEQKQQAALVEKLRQQEIAEKQQAEARARQLERRARSEFAKYIPEIKKKVEDTWIPLSNSAGRLAILEVEINPLGEVQSVEIYSSSGSTAFDRSVSTAVRKASPLPIPREAEIFEYFKRFRFEFSGTTR